MRCFFTDYELPGPTRRKAVCDECGQLVRNGREVITSQGTLCRPCAGEAYFKPLGFLPASIDDPGPKTGEMP